MFFLLVSFVPYHYSLLLQLRLLLLRLLLRTAAAAAAAAAACGHGFLKAGRAEAANNHYEMTWVSR